MSATPHPAAPARDADALAARWLDPAIAPVHGGSEVEPLLDGERYQGAVLDAIARTSGPPDAVLVLAWQLDPDWRGLGSLLAARAEAGVDVRIVLNCTPTPVNPWRPNLAAARRLRRHPALARGLALDWSGASWTGSHHQKCVLVRTGDEAVGFVAGMDLVPDHCDRPPHDAKRWRDGTRWGWHDAGARVRGPAAGALWDAFAARWAEASRRPGPGALPPQADAGASQRVQVLRAAFRWRGGVREIHRGLRRAIAAAERYVYVEDQFLSDDGGEQLGLPFRWPSALVPIPDALSLYPALAARLRERPALKVVLVGSGKSDPIDTIPGERNRRPTRAVRALAGPGLAAWRVEDVTVHSKLVLVDDAYAAIGSANFTKRSMAGVDDELQVAFVDAGGAVRRLRQELWSELWGGDAPEVAGGDLDRALRPWFSRERGGLVARVRP